jgi:ATP-dependent Lhr-like helicase
LAEPVLRFLDRQNRAAPIPIDSPVQVEIVPDGRSRVVQFHILAGTGVNRSLSWCVGHRLGAGHSVMGNFDDHSFLLTFSAKTVPDEDRLRAAFRPDHFLDDLQGFVQSTETLGYGFRNVAETGQLMPRRTWQGRVAPKAQSWNGNLLYSTLLKYEPEHPLVVETVREVIEDRMDGQRAQEEAARIYASPWEVFRHPRPSPFALPLYAAFNREVLIAQDPEQLFADWDEAEIHEPVA